MSRRRDQRGLSESVQHALIFPVLMLVTLGVIQAGIWIHGHNVASRAAAAGAEIARGSSGQLRDARDAAVRLAEQGGLRDVAVETNRSQASVQVMVTGRAPLILDIGLGEITEYATAPLERVTNP